MSPKFMKLQVAPTQAASGDVDFRPDAPFPLKYEVTLEPTDAGGLSDVRTWDNHRRGMMLVNVLIAERHRTGPDHDKILTNAMAERILAKVIEEDEIRDEEPLALRRAMRLACSGEFERAGRLWLKYIQDKENAVVHARFVEVGKRTVQGLQRSRAKASKVLKEAAQRRHAEWKRIGLPIRTLFPNMPDMQLAKVIAERTDHPEGWHAIRKVLEPLGLQRRRKTVR